jgi:hypothetical protein
MHGTIWVNVPDLYSAANGLTDLETMRANKHQLETAMHCRRFERH